MGLIIRKKKPNIRGLLRRLIFIPIFLYAIISTYRSGSYVIKYSKNQLNLYKKTMLLSYDNFKYDEDFLHCHFYRNSDTTKTKRSVIFKTRYLNFSSSNYLLIYFFSDSLNYEHLFKYQQVIKNDEKPKRISNWVYVIDKHWVLYSPKSKEASIENMFKRLDQEQKRKNDSILTIKVNEHIYKEISELNNYQYHFSKFKNVDIEYAILNGINTAHTYMYVTFKIYNKSNITNYQIYKVYSKNKKIDKIIDNTAIGYIKYKILDLNLDYINDLAINWQYCNANISSNSYSIYLFDNNKDTFYYKNELDFNTKLLIDTLNNSLIVENKCEYIWRKYIWNNFDLIQTEEIIFENTDDMALSPEVRKHYKFSNNKKTLISQEKTSLLPNNWYSHELK